ncbi:hypothetical protein F4678DRAFT_415517 [Xylaria arbuscula]|nr:hypothetical protein F4678DRAFT_415517 [Xylaria arbuscula]
MSTSIKDPVTIDRAYFETLLRRANQSNDGPLATQLTCNDVTIVQVPKKDYEDLVLFSHQFANLKRSLLGAGVTEENIATLVQDATGNNDTGSYVVVTPPYDRNQSEGPEARPEQTIYPSSTFEAASYTYNPSANGASGNASYFAGGARPYTSEGSQDWSSHERLGGTFTPSYSADGPTDVPINSSTQVHRTIYARICQRTIIFCGLPAFTTLADVTNVVRCGRLLDVFLRSAEHIASVSFVREEDAVQFYEHARKNDIYIKNKRVFTRWADKHFILPGHIANKIAAGATRNLIIRRCGAHHTEDSVREDLEHIHNLIVVKVEFVGGSCYIKTNSVHNAMFARTCMMSRATYKGSKIEWDIDECDQPFEVVQKAWIKPHIPAKTAVAKTSNRFDMLRLDDDDNKESDDKFDTSSEMPTTVDVAA